MSSDSPVTRTTTSSPTCMTVSPRGITTRPWRTTATTLASRGTSSSDRGRPGRRVVGEGDLDQVGLAPLELQEPHQRPDRDRLLDQGGEQVGRRDGDVDAPRLVEQPPVLRVVDPGDDPGDGELHLGQQGHDEVVLVVAGGGDHDVGGVERGRAKRDTSHASPSSHSTPRPGRRRATRSTSCSMSRTLWPSSCRSPAMAVPTLPAPAMTTRISAPFHASARPGTLECRPRPAGRGTAARHLPVRPGRSLPAGRCRRG